MPVNNGLHETETVHMLFEVVFRCVTDSGGDGWGYIVCNHYKELADEFDNWQKSKKWPFQTREDDEDKTYFHTDQEGITFMGKMPDNTYGMEIIVSVPWAAGLA